MHDRQHDAPTYRHVAPAYDALASVYSLGAIDRAKAFHHSLIEQGDRVLYAGAGRGREIVGAIQRRADVTCVEPCSAMAMCLHKRLSAVADNFAIVPKPIQSLHAEPTYDLVVAHFFLNVFDMTAMPDVLGHLCKFVKPNGRIVIADFAPATPDAGLVDRAARWLHYRPLNLAGRLLRICALHPIYDYAPLLTGQGFTIESREVFQVISGLPSVYEVIVAKRP
ncbi:MAG: class I SAM-dependent methyltransferase [Phycisphaeraceae bacterium]